MKTKCKPKRDYVAEVGLPSAKLVDVFTDVLKNKHGLETKTVSGCTNDFLSEDPEHSFRKAVIKTVSAHIQWDVEKISSKQCRISISFNLPRWLKTRFHSIFILLGCILFSAASVILRYGRFGFTKTSDSMSLITLISICVLTGAMILHYMALDLCVRLLNRYIVFVRGLLQNICESQPNEPSPAYFKPVPVKSKGVIDWEVIIFGTCAFVGVVIILTKGDLIKDIVNSTLGLALLVSCIIMVFLFYRASWKTENRYSLMARATPMGLNCCIAFTIGSLLLGMPIIAYLWAESTMSVQTVDRIRLQYIIMCSTQFIVCFLAISVLVVSVRQFTYYWDGWPTGYGKYLQQNFDVEAANAPNEGKISLNLSLRTKVTMVLLFLTFSLSCWAGVFINISLANAIIAPEFRLIPISYGETIAKGAMLVANSMLGGFGKDRSTHVLRLLLLMPTVSPFVLLVVLNVRALILSHLETRSLILTGGDVTMKTKYIAVKIGVPNVLCFLDRQSNRLSPYAKVIGWRPRNTIVFTERGLAFLANHPAYIDAIIAHEVAHLERDCLTLWKLRLLSRLGLLGVGCLSPLHDSIAMEDRADDAARRYLRENGKDENLLAEAVSMMAAKDYFDSESYSLGQKASAVFLPRGQTSHTAGSQTKESFFKRIVTALRTAHDIYFRAELYDYIHREAKYRRTQPDLRGA